MGKLIFLNKIDQDKLVSLKTQLIKIENFEEELNKIIATVKQFKKEYDNMETSYNLESYSEENILSWIKYLNALRKSTKMVQDLSPQIIAELQLAMSEPEKPMEKVNKK